MHWQACKRVLRYLKGSQDIGLHIQPAKEQCLIGFSDADWAGSLDDRRSTGGYCIYLGPNLVSWSSKKQEIVAQSTEEAEFIAATAAVNQALWLKKLMDDLLLKQEEGIEVFVDNQAALAISHNRYFMEKQSISRSNIIF